MLIEVTDPHDHRLDSFRWRDRQLASRSDRREVVGSGLFVAEGDLVVQRALSARCQPVALLCDASMGEQFSTQLPDVEIYVADDMLRRDVTGLGVPLKATGLFRRPPLVTADDLVAVSNRLVVLESVDNPTNLGAIVRHAVALGWDGIVLTNGSADPLARRALRVSMGTGLHLPFARLDDNDTIDALLARHHCTSVALTPHHEAHDLRHFALAPHHKAALLLGSERDGLLPETLAASDARIRIPMFHNTDSLNVAAAAAIALYALGPSGQ